jgi:GNAT superfamily N-acetyltransferase
MTTIDPPAANDRPTHHRPSVEELGDAAADAIRGHMDHLFRAFFCPPGSLLTKFCMRYITDSPHPLGNAAFVRRGASLDEVAGALEPLLGLGLPSAVVLMNDDRPEQAGAVESRGFVLAEAMPLMSVTPATLAPTALPSGYTYRQVALDEDAAWSEAVSAGYGLPLELGSLFGVRRAHETCEPGVARHFAVEHEGKLVATSLLYVHDGLAGIYGVATLPEHRGKGLAAHLTAEPLRTAWGEGYNTGLLQASAMGAAVYARIGFHTHASMALYVRMPPNA